MQQGFGFWDAAWSWSLALMGVTIVIHATAVALIASALIRLHARRPKLFDSVTSIVVMLVVVTLALCLLLGVEAYLWAIVYVKLGAIDNFKDAMYFSVDSMTTRGASGLTLSGRWQIMGALEAANGWLLFSVSAALMLALLQRITPIVKRRHERNG